MIMIMVMVVIMMMTMMLMMILMMITMMTTIMIMIKVRGMTPMLNDALRIAVGQALSGKTAGHSIEADTGHHGKLTQGITGS